MGKVGRRFFGFLPTPWWWNISATTSQHSCSRPGSWLSNAPRAMANLSDIIYRFADADIFHKVLHRSAWVALQWCSSTVPLLLLRPESDSDWSLCRLLMVVFLFLVHAFPCTSLFTQPGIMTQVGCNFKFVLLLLQMQALVRCPVLSVLMVWVSTFIFHVCPLKCRMWSMHRI